jgi:hypothetical protein
MTCLVPTPRNGEFLRSRTVVTGLRRTDLESKIRRYTLAPNLARSLALAAALLSVYLRADKDAQLRHVPRLAQSF